MCKYLGEFEDRDLKSVAFFILPNLPFQTRDLFFSSDGDDVGDMEKRADPRNRIGGGQKAGPAPAPVSGKPRQQGRRRGHGIQSASELIKFNFAIYFLELRKGYERGCVNSRTGHGLVESVDLDFGVPPFCPTDQPILPNIHLPQQTGECPKSKPTQPK